MSTRIKNYLSLFCFNSFLFIVSIFSFEVHADTNIIAKKGDTLYKISRQYSIPLKALMHKNNFNDANKIIEGEVIILPFENSNQVRNNENLLTYKVIKGDTLFKISREYKVKIKDIISLNKLGNDLNLKINQIILLPNGATINQVTSKNHIKPARKKVFYHLTTDIEDLSTIAKLHRITMNEINTLNKLNNPIKINPNIKLLLRENIVSKWQKYESIFVNWSKWTYFDGNYVSKAKTKKNTPFNIAINCKQRALNNTLDNSSWTNWYFPKSDFEFKLINDFCDNEFNF